MKLICVLSFFAFFAAAEGPHPIVMIVAAVVCGLSFLAVKS